MIADAEDGAKSHQGRNVSYTPQSGLPDFRVANIVRDSRILEIAREEAEAWLARDPDLTAPTSRRLRAVLEDRWAGRLELARVG